MYIEKTSFWYPRDGKIVITNMLLQSRNPDRAKSRCIITLDCIGALSFIV